jgi:hypothetical protein
MAARNSALTRICSRKDSLESHLVSCLAQERHGILPGRAKISLAFGISSSGWYRFFTRNKFPTNFFGIKDYKPSSFVEHSATPFFFFIGGKIKFGSAIGEL